MQMLWYVCGQNVYECGDKQMDHAVACTTA